MVDVETLLQKKIVFLFCGDTPAFVFYLPVNELISFD